MKSVRFFFNYMKLHDFLLFLQDLMLRETDTDVLFAVQKAIQVKGITKKGYDYFTAAEPASSVSSVSTCL